MLQSNRQVKKLLYQFMRQQLALANGDQGEVFQLRPRQKLRRGPLPNLTLRTLAEQGIRYLILLHFANFVSVYFVDMKGVVVTVKNFDRKRDAHALAELPRLAKRIFVYPKKEKIPAKHEPLLKKAAILQKQFWAKIHTIEKVVGIRLPSRKLPGIALTEQAQGGVIHVPATLRTPAQLDQFFTIEAFRLFIPPVFKPHSEPLAQTLTCVFLEDPMERSKASEQLPEALREMINQTSPKTLTRQQTKSFLALLRFWARYEDHTLSTAAFHLVFAQIVNELSRSPMRPRMEIAASISETLFRKQGNTRDLLRLTCFLVLSENKVLIQEYSTHKVFQLEDNVAMFCRAMLTLRFCPLYRTRSQILTQLAGPKFTRLFQQAFEYLQKQILRLKRRGNQFTLVNQSDLEVTSLTLRSLASDPEEVLVTIPQLGPDTEIDFVFDYELESEQLMARFTDNFGNDYQVLI